MRTIPFLALSALAASACAQSVTPTKTTLKVGDTAPDFTISAKSNTGGKDIRLSEFRGQKNVILAFFPAAFTGG